MLNITEEQIMKNLDVGKTLSVIVVIKGEFVQ